MRSFYIFLLFFSLPSSLWAENKIHLQVTPYSHLKECRNLKNLSYDNNLTELEKIRRFSIPDEDVLTISLLNSAKRPCYTFHYIPEVSPDLNLKIKNRKIMILEMHGSTLNGNWLEKQYSIDLINQILLQISVKHISFSTDTDGNRIETISDWNILEP